MNYIPILHLFLTIKFIAHLQIGNKIMQYSGQSNLKKVSLELGGKSPLVIFDDVDCTYNTEKSLTMFEN